MHIAMAGQYLLGQCGAGARHSEDKNRGWASIYAAVQSGNGFVKAGANGGEQGIIGGDIIGRKLPAQAIALLKVAKRPAPRAPPFVDIGEGKKQIQALGRAQGLALFKHLQSVELGIIGPRVFEGA